MPKKRASRSAAVPRNVIFLAVLTVLLFLAGEAWLLLRGDSGRILAARYLGWGDDARVTQLIGRQIRKGLEAMAVPRDSVKETIHEHAAVPLHWRVGLAPGASLLQVNYAITRCVEDQGGAVLSGEEQSNAAGESEVVLVVGLHDRPTHTIRLVRPTLHLDETPAGGGRVAIVLYAFAEDDSVARRILGLRVPFAAAIVPGEKNTEFLEREAREHDREIVLHVPLEPLNYPAVNPGPGTLLVTMKPGKITGQVKRWLDQAGPVAAVANHMGSLATQDMTVMTALYDELKRRHAPFLHVTPAAGAVCKALASDLGVAYAEPDEVIDGEARASDAKSLDKRWSRVLDRARTRTSTIVMLRATPLVRTWLERATTPKRLDGASLVPLSSVLRRPADLQ